MRLDQRITQLKEISRSKACDLIKEGYVKVNGRMIDKPAFQVEEQDAIEIEEAENDFASRAGGKLFHALEEFKVDLHDKVVLDVGASTGGFTDVCLNKGAEKVYAVDVGSDQLIERLRLDPRVVNMENTNCRYLKRTMFKEPIDFVCMDVSFISILAILPCLFQETDAQDFIILIKPQFETEKRFIGKNGIVKDRKVHENVLKKIVTACTQLGLYPVHLAPSKVCGRDGNQEYCIHLIREMKMKDFDYREIVKSGMK